MEIDERYRKEFIVVFVVREVIPDENIAKEFLSLLHCFLSHPASNLHNPFSRRSLYGWYLKERCLVVSMLFGNALDLLP